MKLTDTVRGMKTSLATASRELWSLVSSKEFWRVKALRTADYWRGEWAQVTSPSRLYGATAVAVAFLFTSSFIAVRHVNQTGAWTRVYTNGSYVGMVPDNQAVLTTMQRIANGYNVNLQLYPVHTAVSPQYDWARVAELPMSAAAIVVDGKSVVYTKNRLAAEQVLADLKKLLTPAHLGKNIEVHFLQTVAIASVNVGVTNILPPDAALRYLLRPSAGQASGRAESAIPIALTKTPQEKSLTSNKASQNNGPLISVETFQTTNRTQKVSFPVHYQSTNQLGLGQIQIVQQGAPGVVKEVVKQKYVNDKLVSEQVLSKHVIQAAKPEVAERGTNAGIAAGSWTLPVTSYVVTSPFGWRTLFGSPNFHPGIDLACPIGTPIYATNNGVVEDAGWNNGGYGIWAKINNGRGIETVFGHMSRVVVHSGQTVAKGQLLGYSGETGFATGPHLHYEVRLNGTPINPQPYM